MRNQTTATLAHPTHPTVVSNELPAFVTYQCGECGVIENGPMQGLYPTTASGLVAIIAGEYINHDECDRCRNRRLAR